MTQVIVQRFCFHCDAERAVDAETFRCQSCGHPTARGEVVDRLRAETAVRTNGTAVSAPAEPLELPDTTAMRKWIDQTRALAEGFAASAAKKREQATQLAAEASRLQRAADAYRGLLSQLQVPRIEPMALPSGGGNRWAKGFDACIDCGRSSVKHIAHGRCGTCDSKWRAKGQP